MASAPFLGGGFGHFYAYAPERLEYPINRFTMEVKRQLDVLDRNLADREFICGNDYTIADIAIHPWYGALAMGMLYESGEFLDVGSYKTCSAGPRRCRSGPPYDGANASIGCGGMRPSGSPSGTARAIWTTERRASGSASGRLRGLSGPIAQLVRAVDS